MSLYRFDVKKNIKFSKLIKKLEDDNAFYSQDISNIIEKYRIKDNLGQLGTIGSGNHFAEIQIVKDIYDKEIFENSGLFKTDVFLLVHSGSRRYGYDIYDYFIKYKKAQNGFSKKNSSINEYMEKHNKALDWAKTNRDIVAEKFFRIINAKSINKVLESVHNCIEEKSIGNKKYYYHRKGAATANDRLGIIPGSRGTLTYLVEIKDVEKSGFSIAHGAGRKWERSVCKGKLYKKYNLEEIKKTKLSGRVICNNKDLLYEEATEAYKDINRVIKSLESFDLIKVIATFVPKITYKN